MLLRASLGRGRRVLLVAALVLRAASAMEASLGAAAAAAAAGAAAAAAAAPAAEAADVVVIGGGVSGLRVARGALAAGLSCRLLEARTRVGGRLLSRAGLGDLGAAWSWRGERRVAALAQELGVARFAQHEQGDALLDRGAAAAPARVAGGEGARMEGLRFAGGAQALADGLAARLPEGAVRLGARATAVRGWGGSGGGGAGGNGSAAIVEFVGEDGLRGALAARVAVVLALPPALAAASVAFEPPLPAAVAALAAATPTWMASMAKTVVTYSEPFWRTAGLSGSAFDGGGGGPLSEVYDHGGAPAGAAGGPHALFGFSQGAPERAAVLAQLARLFGPQAALPLAVETMDWSREPLTAGAGKAPRGNPRANYGDRAFARPVGGGAGVLLLWSSTETGEDAPGHIEGALSAADRAIALIVRAAAGGGGSALH
jgi:monoamine oxidase